MSKDVICLMLFVAQEGRCFHCDSEFKGKGSGKSNTQPRLWTRDHIKLACEGHTKHFNTVLACGRCNANRGNRKATPGEQMKAEAIFKKVMTISAAFYGNPHVVWPPAPTSLLEASP